MSTDATQLIEQLQRGEMPAGYTAANAARLVEQHALDLLALAGSLGGNGVRDGALFLDGKRYEVDLPPRLWSLLAFLVSRQQPLIADVAAAMGKRRDTPYTQLRQELHRLNNSLFVAGCPISFVKARRADRIEIESFPM